jgi:hypothetical protein
MIAIERGKPSFLAICGKPLAGQSQRVPHGRAKKTTYGGLSAVHPRSLS